MTSENVGMSSVKACENHAHRKPKVSYATFIGVGLVRPKLNPNGVGDGQWVNTPIPLSLCFKAKGGHRKVGRACLMDMVCSQLKVRQGRQIHPDIKLRGGRICGATQENSAEPTLARKASLLKD
jgi:hypothetical protein